MPHLRVLIFILTALLTIISAIYGASLPFADVPQYISALSGKPHDGVLFSGIPVETKTEEGTLGKSGVGGNEDHASSSYKLDTVPRNIFGVRLQLEVNTPGTLIYNFYPASSSGCFTFKVRALSDAIIALDMHRLESNSNPMFEIFLGGWSNSKSVIRKNCIKPDFVEVNTPGILNAVEFRGFWIRWYANVITVGREGEAAGFLSWEDPGMPPIHYVGIRTAWGISGTWLIDEDKNNSTSRAWS